jgi:transposase
VWFAIKLPFMIIKTVPYLGQLIRREAASAYGKRAQSGGEQLTPADDQAAVAAALAGVKSRDAGFDVAVPVRGVVRAREVVDRARRTGDASAARQVLADGLWRVLVLLLDVRAAHEVRRQGSSRVTATRVVSVTRDQLAEQLRIRLTCQGERCEVVGADVLRGGPGPQEWLEDWTVRRSATATTPAHGGVLDGRCPQCGADLQVDQDGSCAYCRALVLTGGRDWVVWSIEEAPW